jgi:hypothetical protein
VIGCILAQANHNRAEDPTDGTHHECAVASESSTTKLELNTALYMLLVRISKFSKHRLMPAGNPALHWGLQGEGIIPNLYFPSAKGSALPYKQAQHTVLLEPFFIY